MNTNPMIWKDILEEINNFNIKIDLLKCDARNKVVRENNFEIHNYLNTLAGVFEEHKEIMVNIVNKEPV